VVLHESARASSDFAENTSGPSYEPEPGLSDKAMVHVAGGGKGSIEVLKVNVDILILGTRSGSDSEYAETLKSRGVGAARAPRLKKRIAPKFPVPLEMGNLLTIRTRQPPMRRQRMSPRCPARVRGLMRAMGNAEEKHAK
jgi:hypothetical protein